MKEAGRGSALTPALRCASSLLLPRTWEGGKQIATLPGDGAVAVTAEVVRRAQHLACGWPGDAKFCLDVLRP
jgi:hypothetical protein